MFCVLFSGIVNGSIEESSIGTAANSLRNAVNSKSAKQLYISVFDFAGVTERKKMAFIKYPVKTLEKNKRMR